MRNFPKARSRILCIALSLLLFLPLTQPAAAASIEKIKTFTVPVYRSASAASLVIGQVADGTAVKIVGQTGDFYEIDCSPMRGFLPISNIHYVPDTGYVVTCGPQDPGAGMFPQYIPPEGFALRTSLMKLCNSLLGTPYVYGGNSPQGFDCSGFVSYVFRQHDIQLHRCADEQMQDGLVVAREDLQVGDLVFFSVYGPWLASHVGIYAGNNRMIHAGSGGITYDSLDAEYWANSYVGARRILVSEPLQETGDPEFFHFPHPSDSGTKWIIKTQSQPLINRK